MRYEKGHKETTRQKIIETAAARFRRDGISGVGVADLMAEVGLTHGGFYSHFASKEALVKAAMEEAAHRSSERFKQRVSEGGLERWIRSYMSASHRDHPERGCTIAALAAELARHPKATRLGITDYVRFLKEAIELHLPQSMSKEDKKRRSIGVLATLMGTVQMARAVSDPALSDEILEAGIVSAIALAEIQEIR